MSCHQRNYYLNCASNLKINKSHSDTFDIVKSIIIIVKTNTNITNLIAQYYLN